MVLHFQTDFQIQKSAVKMVNHTPFILPICVFGLSSRWLCQVADEKSWTFLPFISFYFPCLAKCTTISSWLKIKIAAPRTDIRFVLFYFVLLLFSIVFYLTKAKIMEDFINDN